MTKLAGAIVRSRAGEIASPGRWTPDAPQARRVSAILEPLAAVPEDLSPLHFEWALAQETVNTQYGGDLSWKTDVGGVHFVLELPLKEN